jgi:hypothetical protein
VGFAGAAAERVHSVARRERNLMVKSEKLSMLKLVDITKMLKPGVEIMEQHLRRRNENNGLYDFIRRWGSSPRHMS